MLCQVVIIIEDGVPIEYTINFRIYILFQDTFTGENVVLNCVIADKNVVIRDNKMLSGDESLPFYLAKGKMI